MAKSVAESIKKIREVYELGCGLSPKSANGEGEAVKFATEKKVGHGTVYRAKQFARMFSKKDVDRLCKLCNDDNSLSWGHVPMIFTMQSEQERWELLDLAAQNNWSARDLKREIDKRYRSKRKYGGGKMKTAADAAGLVQQIAAKSSTWLRFDGQLRDENDHADYQDKLPASVRNALCEAYAAMQKLNQVAEAVELRKPRAKRKK